MNLTCTYDFDFATFYTLRAPTGVCVEICSVGAAISRILLPDREGILRNVVLRFADKRDYLNASSYAGAVLAPNAGRISDARISIGNSTYHLTANDGVHNLHGGNQSASFCNWTLKDCYSNAEKAVLILETALPDGQDGFPGNRLLQATYTLNTEQNLSICYTASSDQPTYLNLSNHTYFNLSGDFSQNALSQSLQISADTFLANDKEHLPKEICPVHNTPFDFHTAITLSKQMLAYPNDAQLQNANGYNNGFILSSTFEQPSAILYDAISGRRLELSTNAPCLVLYSGGYLAGSPTIENHNGLSIPALSSAALALEAQDFPNAPNSSFFPCHFLGAAETYQRKIDFHFSCI